MTTILERSTDDGPMGLDLASPAGPPRGGVVVIQEAFGVTAHIAGVADRLAAAGYVAVVPHLFHRSGDPVLGYDDFAAVMPHMQALTAAGIDADVDAALDFLRDEGLVDAQIAIVGFCMGGAVSLATASRLALGAAATFYGGGIVEGRFGYPPLVELAPRMPTPWIGFFGDEDTGIPSEQVEALREAASRAGAPTELHRYPGAGHGFNCDDRDAYHEAAATDAWTRMLDWFASHVAVAAAP
jgi:carboxymethylenebutenolidase